jgi:hypothetical protein
VGKGFAGIAADATGFPAALMSQTEDFTFAIAPDLSEACRQVQEGAPDLLLIDADGEPLDEVRRLVRDARRLRPPMPIIAFSARSDDRMRYLMVDGASWHFTKRSRGWHRLAETLRRHVPSMMLPAVGEPARDGVPPANPYVVGRPLVGPTESLYIGREDVFAWLAENLSGAARPNALMLFGRRRIGKTSTLYQLVEGIRGAALRGNRERPFFPVYVDLQRYAGRPTDEWLRQMARDVDRRANKSWSPRPRDDFAAGGSAYEAFDRCLDRLEAALPAGGILLLAIDELEQARVGIESGVLAAEVLAFLRWQMQHRERVVFLLCGSRGLLEPFWGPIVDLTARWELGPLTYEATTALIRQPVSGAIAFEDAALDAIWRRTTGHPYLVQIVCHRLVGLANRDAGRATIGRPHVEAIIDQLANEGFFARLELGDGRSDGSPHSPAQIMEALQ